MQFGTLFVQRAIIHQIPKVRRADKDKYTPRLSEVPSVLQDRHKLYFRERIVRSLEAQSFDVVYDDQSTSPVPQLVVDFFVKSEDDLFVEASRQMAIHLYGLQSGISSEGLLAVVEATIGSGDRMGKCLVVLKLEQDRSIQFTEATHDGKATFDVEVQEVTLAESTKVFKAALFERAASLDGLRGVMSDNQRNPHGFGGEIAGFYLSDFLGCKQVATADRATKDFLERSQDWINEFVLGEDKKAQYTDALIVELRSQKGIIDPKEFAEEQLEPEDRDSFTGRFRDDDGRVEPIVKENTLIANRLREVVYVLDNGIRLTGPSDTIVEATTFESGRVIIDGSLRDVGVGRMRSARKPPLTPATRKEPPTEAEGDQLP
jgi:hypothetical protein